MSPYFGYTHYFLQRHLTHPEGHGVKPGPEGLSLIGRIILALMFLGVPIATAAMILFL